MSEIYPTRRNPKTIIIAIILVSTIAIASFAILTYPKPSLKVYTYDSFMLWGDNPETIDDTVFGPFEREHGIEVEIIRLPTDANGIVSRLVAEQENPQADVVIGIDNILILQDAAKSVLEPYSSPNLNLIDEEVVSALDSDHHVIPFDLGLVSIIYEMDYLNTTSHPELDNFTFTNLATDFFASSLVTENPHQSSPGLAFLLGQIAIYEKILETDWKDWWNAVKDDVDVQAGWTEAWTIWYESSERNMLVSYGTDPAYSSYYSGEEPNVAVAPMHYNDQDYAWMQIEGIGLVKDGPNQELAKLFVDYCLSAQVQQYVGLNQWMFPANNEVTLDDAFAYALHPDDVSLLNALLPSSEIAANLTEWLDEWDLIMA
ncbi:MAG: thiamine ABC transporter substrate-binding protein [Candidatus Lokiarchaeota archaeon]|nr:thiamine ABC transporter substrate-binding protein [Candidatus Lokiarchaeota archaeon]